MNKIKQYNQLIEIIVYDFVCRLYKEEWIEDTVYKTDYRIMDYQGINQWPVEIWDRFLSIDDIIMCEKYKISTKLLIEYYDKWLEAYYDNKTLWVNFYNYCLREKDNQWYYENEFEQLKQSKEKAKQAKKQLETILKERA